MARSSVKPVSQVLFERFCREIGIKCSPIPEDPKGSIRTPDYELEIQSTRIVVEVKQLDPNQKEKLLIRELKEKKIASKTETPGKRVGQEIADSMKQLGTRAKGRLSAMSVIYNNIDFGPRLIDPYDVMVGMYGQEVVEIAVPPTGSTRPPTITGFRFGGKRRVTPEHNTTLSAVAALNDLTPELTLWVYHNIHAAIQLEPSLLCHSRIHHFTLAAQTAGERPQWVEITT